MKKVFSVAETFWQYTGLGISSRFAERGLQLLDIFPAQDTPRIPLNPISQNSQYLLPNARVSSRYSSKDNLKLVASVAPASIDVETDENILPAYVEENRDNNFQNGHDDAKRVLRCRIADILAGRNSEGTQILKETWAGSEILTESDVYLHPTGMSAIFSAHQLAMSLQKRVNPNSPIGKSICFGFPYANTLKMLERWGPGVHFFGHGEATDIEELEKMLHLNQVAGCPSMVALFCEFPSNPLLKSPDLERLRFLADQCGSLIVIDDTIGNFVNVDVLPYSDILVSSLTKVFSGKCTVMGGSMIVNPSSRHHKTLKGILDGDKINPSGAYEDNYFEQDAIEMEKKFEKCSGEGGKDKPEYGKDL